MADAINEAIEDKIYNIKIWFKFFESLYLRNGKNEFLKLIHREGKYKYLVCFYRLIGNSPTQLLNPELVTPPLKYFEQIIKPENPIILLNEWEVDFINQKAFKEIGYLGKIPLWKRIFQPLATYYFSKSLGRNPFINILNGNPDDHDMKNAAEIVKDEKRLKKIVSSEGEHDIYQEFWKEVFGNDVEYSTKSKSIRISIKESPAISKNLSRIDVEGGFTEIQKTIHLNKILSSGMTKWLEACIEAYPFSKYEERAKELLAISTKQEKQRPEPSAEQEDDKNWTKEAFPKTTIGKVACNVLYADDKSYRDYIDKKEKELKMSLIRKTKAGYKFQANLKWIQDERKDLTMDQILKKLKE